MLLEAALTNGMDNREIFIKDIDYSCYFERFTTFKAECLEDFNYI